MTDLRQIPMELAELEALKLCDLDGLTQEEAGRSMNLSRGTVQRILTSARRKSAETLVHGCALVFPISGREKK